MATFDGITKTPTRVNLAKDAFQPHMGSLGRGSATEEAKIHGERVHQIDGDFRETIALNVNTVVKGTVVQEITDNYMTVVGENRSDIVSGTYIETIIGPHIITTMNVFNETRIGAHIQTHGGIMWQHDKANEWHVGVLNVSFYAVSHEMQIEHFEAALHHHEIKGMHNYFAVNDNAAVLVQFQTKPLNVKADVTEAKIYAMECEIMALGARAGMLEGHLVPLKANAGARVGLDTPFGG